jgi:hypothetical protein
MAEVVINQFDMVPAPPPASPEPPSSDESKDTALPPEAVERITRRWEERGARVRAH